MYSPALGRFLQTDPIGYADGMNLYEYVKSNPVNYTDPLGQWSYGGVIESYWKLYGNKGWALYRLALMDGIPIRKRDYAFHDWYYEGDGTLGIASGWWFGDDSDETAAKQLHDALYEKYGGLLSELMQGMSECVCGSISQAGRNKDVMDLLTQAGYDDGVRNQWQEIRANSARFGAQWQRYLEEEIKTSLFAIAGVKCLGKAADLADDVLDARRAAKKITGTTVLGKYPDYIKLSDKIKAKRFQIPDNIWRGMTLDEQWIANRKFLDRLIRRGDDILLSNPVRNINDVSGYFRKELDYLIGKGYGLSKDGSRLVRIK